MNGHSEREVGIRNALAAAAIVAGASLLGLAGCRVDTHKENGNDNVKIATPFGGMSVKTNDNVVQSGLGLTAYPGATLVKKDSDGDHDNGAADINMNFGSFHLGVKAMSYQTPDAPAKVLAFYRKDMNRYGIVIECRGHKPVSSPSITHDGLSCSDDKNNHIQVDEDSSDNSDASKNELKAGSKQHQHIVSVEPNGAGTKIGLVALDLPGHFGPSEDDSKQ